MIRIARGQQTSDGAGVKLYRIIGSTEVDNVNPFYLLDEFKSDNKDNYIAGFPMHPHRGIETITYMLEGSFIHRDSEGHEGHLKSGEVQWMTAGRGLLHEEMPAMEEGQLWGYQLWVNLPAKDKMTEPKYRHLKAEDMPVVSKNGVEVKIISGNYEGNEGPVKSLFPVDYLDVSINEGIFEKEARSVNAIYVHTGRVTVQEAGKDYKVEEGSICILEGTDSVKVSADKAGFLYLGSEPINEPVAKYGPFIMNTMDEIIQAVDDFNSMEN